MRYSDVRELTSRFMFMVICFFFPHVLLLLMQPRVKEKAIQVLPERYPHKHVDDLLKVRKTFYCNLLFFSFYKQTFLLLMLASSSVVVGADLIFSFKLIKYLNLAGVYWIDRRARP